MGEKDEEEEGDGEADPRGQRPGGIAGAAAVAKDEEAGPREAREDHEEGDDDERFHGGGSDGTGGARIGEARRLPLRQMTSFYGRGSMLAPSVVALVVVVLGTSLGFWQLRRADEKAAMQARMERAEAAPPLDVSAALRGAGASIDEVAAALDGKRVIARGTFAAGHTVFLDNRTREGVAGFHVLSPLRLADSDRAVLVLRGWAPRDPADRKHLPPVPTPAEAVQVEGMAQARLAQPLMLGEDPDPSPGDGLWQHFDYGKFTRWSGLAVVPVIVRQTAEHTYRDGLARDWNQPGVSLDRHHGYAFQWFALAAAALVFWGVLLRRHLKGSDVHDDT